MASAAPAALPAGTAEEPSADAPDSEEIQEEIQAESAELQNFRRAETDAHLLEDLRPGDGAADEASRLGLESPLRLRLRDALRRQGWGGQHAPEPIPGLPEIDHDLERLQAEYDIPIEVNEAVIAYVRFFQSPKVRPHFVRWLSRSHRYIPRYREIMKEEGLPEDTVYLAMIESGFSNMATSVARAVGPWQFMPATGKLMGLDQDFWVDERRDPERAARAAARFLKQLYSDFGDWRLAWAGYNAGPGKITRAQRAGQRDFWEMTRGRILRPETKGYVPKLMAAAIVSKHAEAFGFSRDEIVPEGWIDYDEVVVQRATELSAIAEAAAVPEKAILDLNPELRRTVTPPRPYTVKIPAGQAETFAQNWPEVSARSSRFALTRHQVIRGESLTAIAAAYGVPAKTLAKMNGLKAHRKPRAGSVLVVPLGSLARRNADSAALAMASVEEPPQRATRGKRAVASVKATGAKKGAKSASVIAASVRESKGRETVKVRPGDSLWSIARRFDVAVEELARWNGIRRPAKHKLKAGNTLIVYPNTGANRSRPVASAK
ncbi:MAG TPA: LysM peptidoglycan-binding domain-containing protein [Anaeromyxobacteraceae bacterium]|nr:LysM peptidoglycan-binding domain-containing protein [Anaeromyxobacteraceae bacterium]